MSLINDALKQAKATQPKSGPSADGPALRPVQNIPPHPTDSGRNYLLPAIIIVILLLAAILLWQWFHGGENNSEIQVRARTLPDVRIERHVPVGPAKILAPKPLSEMRAMFATNSSQSAPTTNAVAIPADTHVAISNEAPVGVVTNTVAVAPAPAPLTYKLQSIFWRAKAPAAVVNGKTVFVGDRVGECHVLAVTKESVTLINAAGKTNTLELP